MVPEKRNNVLKFWWAPLSFATVIKLRAWRVWLVLVAYKMKQNKQNVQKLFRQCGCCAIEGESIYRRKTKEYTTKDKQKPPPTLCSWSQTANYKRWIKVKVSRHGARHPGTHSTPHTSFANRVQNCKTLAKCAKIAKRCATSQTAHVGRDRGPFTQRAASVAVHSSSSTPASERHPTGSGPAAKTY